MNIEGNLVDVASLAEEISSDISSLETHWYDVPINLVQVSSFCLSFSLTLLFFSFLFSFLFLDLGVSLFVFPV